MFFYYINLTKNLKSAEIYSRITKAYLKYIEKYLKNAISSLEQKQFKALWKPLQAKRLKLHMIGSVKAIPKITRATLLENAPGYFAIFQRGTNGTVHAIKDKDFDVPLFIWIGKDSKKEKIFLEEKDFRKDIIFFSNELLQLVGGAQVTAAEAKRLIRKVNWMGEDVEIIPLWFNLHKGLTIRQGNKEFVIQEVISNNEFTVNGILVNDLPIVIDNIEVIPKCFEIRTNTTDEHLTKTGTLQVLKEYDDKVIVYDPSSKNKPDYKLMRLLEWNNFRFKDDNSQFHYYLESNFEFSVNNEQEANNLIGKQVVCDNGIKFEIKEVNINNPRHKYRIQLIEEEKEGSDFDELSDLDFFFQDDVDITDDKKNKYKIVEANARERHMVLKKMSGKGAGKITFPEGKELYVQFNTYPLEKQLKAIENLIEKPVGTHINLLKLFKRRDRVQWQHPANDISVDEWYVLTDDRRDGIDIQRKFVLKALNTPDFAILEGPPGSGKTTVILEIILQAIKNNKRILLCGSTHVAIDNVLERLKAQGFIEKFNIFPLRIGDTSRISEEVKEFQIEEVLKSAENLKDLLLDAANLVCGTTIGILQHPHFKNEQRYKPIIPEFDYLIIDECSKTTFQEFLVPALRAKRWILIGDVKQLAPFSDRTVIVENIKNMSKDEINEDFQQAMFYLNAIQNAIQEALKNGIKVILPVNSNAIEFMKREWNMWKKERKDLSSKYHILFISSRDELDSIPKIVLATYDVIVVSRNLFDSNMNISKFFPETHAILLYQHWIKTPHAFRFNYYYRKKHGKPKSEIIFDSIERINSKLKENNWATEIAWRIEREFQVKDIKNVKYRYEEEVDKLLPISIEEDKRRRVMEKIGIISAIAFPSVLEALLKGIDIKRFRYNLKYETTFTDGFDEKTKELRWSVMQYQHRMHPEISRFPREQFYNNEALKDLENPVHIRELRQWGYERYPSRSIWIHVDGKTELNYNEQEADTLIKELKEFLEYAKFNRHPLENHSFWEVACLTFYRGQERKIRERLRRLTGQEMAISTFRIVDGQVPVVIRLHTVDKFQGHEADIVFLSMVQTRRVGFLDNPNRLNVALTRARFQLVIIGNKKFFAEQRRSEHLLALAKSTKEFIS